MADTNLPLLSTLITELPFYGVMIQGSPNDIRYQIITRDFGLIGSRAVETIFGRHVFVSRKGVYLFSGTSNLANLSSSYIESILDSISDTNLALTICRAVNGELWVVIDENNDGKLDSIYILNLKDVIIENITTEIPEWKVYKFNFNINDILPGWRVYREDRSWQPLTYLIISSDYWNQEVLIKILQTLA